MNVTLPSWLNSIYLEGVVKLLAANQHPIGHGISIHLLFSCLISHFCHFESVQNTAANTISTLTTLQPSLFPQSPFHALSFLPQSLTKPCLDVSCSFLQPHWGHGAAGQALPPGCRHVHSHETRASAKPLHTSASALSCLPLPLCTQGCCWRVLLTSCLEDRLQRSGTSQ